MLARTIRRWAAAWLLCLIAATVASADTPLLDLPAHKGKVVVVDFWASWCVPCRRSMPWLNEMQAKYGPQGLLVIGVNVDAQKTDAEHFLAETPVKFQIVYDSDGKLPKELGVKGMPSSFIFDRDGKLMATHIGFQNGKRDEYEETLRRALNGRNE